MEITNVETRTFEMMLAGFEHFAERLESLCREGGEKRMKDWLDTQEVCELLGVQSKRTIQTYRDSGLLPYSQIEHKIYYRPEDVERLMEKLKNGKEVN